MVLSINLDRHNKPWSGYEELVLLKLKEAGEPYFWIAHHMGRSPKAVRSRYHAIKSKR